MILVKATEIAYDIMMNPVVLLIDEKELKALPIWVGPYEANFISLALQGVYLDRPLTHDLFIGTCDKLEAKFSMVLINDMIEGTYMAELHMWHHERKLIIDSRPSDAIALAIRTNTPIYLSEKVATGFLALKDILSEEQQNELKKLLAPNRISDFKKSLN